MESLALTWPCSDVTKLKAHNGNRNSLMVSSANGNYYSCGPCCSASSSLRLRLRLRVMAAAAKKRSEDKVDRHSAVPKPDEATRLFPEAVLLKEKKVQEDGKLLPEFADAEEQELFEALTLQLESDLDVERMRHYEVVYLIHEDRKDEVGNVNEKVQEFIKEKKGRIWRFSDWGMRRLAYKIQKAKNAHYILLNFEIEAKWINDFKTMLDKDERVIRHLVIKRDKAETEECPPPPEFHTLRADMDDNDEDVDYEEHYSDEDDDADWEDDEEIDADSTSYEEIEADGAIYVDVAEEDDTVIGSKGKRKQKMEVVRE